MAQAVMHILVAVILIELYREFFVKDSRNFPRYYVLAAVIGGILPDFDFLVYYLQYPFFGFAYEQIHRTYFHSLWLPLTLLIIGILYWHSGLKNIWLRKRRMNMKTIFFILAAMSLLHLILDSLFWGSVFPFYPLTSIELGLNLLTYFPEDMLGLILPTIDGILLVLWILWMQFKLRIPDYF